MDGSKGTFYNILKGQDTFFMVSNFILSMKSLPSKV